MNLVPYLAELAARVLESNAEALGGRMRLLQVGGAALGNDLWNRLMQLGLPPLQGYGLTEASPVVCSNRAGRQRAGSVGPPVAGVELKVDAQGVLWCCGPNVMLGYWQNEMATDQCLVDGWLCTGDLADIDNEGDVTIYGRASQQIVLSTGYKVSPEAVERELCNDEWIERAVVCGQGRAHVVALLWPSATDSQRDSQRDSSPVPRLTKQQWQTRISERLRRFPRHAIPIRFAWIEQPLSYESGLLTLKGSIRRARIEAHYSATIASLYST
jgi:long-chain acyl-CoA synthetase